MSCAPPGVAWLGFCELVAGSGPRGVLWIPGVLTARPGAHGGRLLGQAAPALEVLTAGACFAERFGSVHSVLIAL